MNVIKDICIFLGVAFPLAVYAIFLLFKEIRELREKNILLNFQLEEEKKRTQEKEALIENVEKKFGDTFKVLSQEALQGSMQSFLEFASAKFENLEERSKGELKLKEQAIETMVKPLADSLKKVDLTLNEMERSRVSAYATLYEQVTQMNQSQKKLQEETSSLVKALKTPHVRGRWGEIQLKRVVEMAGMLNYCDFVEQHTVNTQEGKLRPDMIIKLPMGKKIVVDAKAALHAYLEAIELKDDLLREQKLKDHARLLRKHIIDLSTKAYWDQFDEAPDFVVLFIPGEPFFSAALEQDPSLIEYGVEQKVIIATPTTLIALLRSVAYGWKQEMLAKNALEISDLGKDLYDRVRVLGEHFEEIKKGLEKSIEGYNKTVRSLETRVMPATRRFKELGVTAEKEIAPLEMIDRIPKESLQKGSLQKELLSHVATEENLLT